MTAVSGPRSVDTLFPDDPASHLLRDTTFVIVDLETTGGRHTESAITEIGAVKVRGGEVIGEFQTFVNPGVPIPPFISVLTGITDFHVATAPRIETALPQFLEFAGFAGKSADVPVLVAHNASFDTGFLRAACAATSTRWPDPLVLDTVTLARRVLRSSEVRNHKLATLAAYFGAETTPTHRALDDARATVDVLHGLIGRLGNLGINDVESLLTFDGRGTEQRRRKRHLANSVPDAPGVYIFRDGADHPLYVGVSLNMRKRVMSYFTAAESRRKITAMIEAAQSITAIPCQTPTEARVRELRLIDLHKPRFNHKSTHPERTVWLTLTGDRFPRLSVVRQGNLTDARRVTIGPFPTAELARQAADALHEVFPLRQCTQRLTTRFDGSPCILLDMGKCCAPCINPTAAPGYLTMVTDVGAAMLGDVHSVESALEARMRLLAGDQRYEDAAVARDRLTALTRAIHRAAALRSLCTIPEIVAAGRGRDGGWDIHVIRHGRLAASAHEASAGNVVATALAAAATAATPPDGAPLVAESEILLQWLSTAGTRLIDVTAGHAWHMPASARAYSVELASTRLTDTSLSIAAVAAPESIASAAMGRAISSRVTNDNWGEP